MKKIRVVSLPGRNYLGNDYFKLFCEALEGAGLDVINMHESRAKVLRFDVLHIHFPEHFVTERSVLRAILTVATFVAFLMAIKAMGKRIIWTVHDVHPFKIRHEWLLWPYPAVLRWHIDGFVFMNQSSARQFLSTYPHEGNKPSCRIQHGPYPVRHLSERERACLRSEIAGMEPSFLLASLGDIKPYKNIEALRVSPRHTASGCPVKVLIAGKADPSHYSSQVEDLLNVLGRDRTIRISERLPNVQLEELIQIADLVVLPYREGSNSGFAMLALSCRARILCSPLSMFTDIANNAVWVMNRSRKWIFWRGSAVEIGLITLTQFVFVATIGVHTTRSAAMFSLVAVSASLFAQMYVMFFGFSRHRSSQE